MKALEALSFENLLKEDPNTKFALAHNDPFDPDITVWTDCTAEEVISQIKKSMAFDEELFEESEEDALTNFEEAQQDWQQDSGYYTLLKNKKS